MRVCPKCKGTITPPFVDDPTRKELKYIWECTECNWRGKLKKPTKEQLNELIKIIKTG